MPDPGLRLPVTIPPAVVERLARARSVAVLTGAGISAESGIPTFRGAGGFWRNRDAMQLATPMAFAADPHLVWEFYDERRQGVAAAQPNPGHHTLVAMEAAYERFLLITQNVDGLHQRAGSKKVQLLHGSLWTLRCTGCGRETEDHRAPLPELPPHCTCGAMLRPGVVWFHEPLPEDAMPNALAFVASADVLLVVGTSCVVYPAASLVPSAVAAGVPVIEVNLERAADFDGVTTLTGPSGVVLPQLWAAVEVARAGVR